MNHAEQKRWFRLRYRGFTIVCSIIYRFSSTSFTWRDACYVVGRGHRFLCALWVVSRFASRQIKPIHHCRLAKLVTGLLTKRSIAHSWSSCRLENLDSALSPLSGVISVPKAIDSRCACACAFKFMSSPPHNWLDGPRFHVQCTCYLIARRISTTVLNCDKVESGSSADYQWTLIAAHQFPSRKHFYRERT